MTFTPEQTAALAAPLHTAHVKSRKAGNGMTLSYVEAWHAIAEANRIFGFDGWNRETVDLTQIGSDRMVQDKWRVGYRAKVRVCVRTDSGLVVREGCGFGSGIDKDPDQAHESALKEAESDAMKRALMTFGNPFGLALYDKTQANVTTARPANPDNPPPGGAALTTGAKLLSAQLAEKLAGGRKSSAQAKKDGDDVTIKADIAKSDRDGLRDWHENFDNYTAHLPFSWLDSVRDMLEHRLEELNGEANVAEAEAELDAGFRGTMGGARADGLSGRNGDVAHA